MGMNIIKTCQEGCLAALLVQILVGPIVPIICEIH